MIVTDIILSPNMEESILYDNPLLQHSMYVVPYDRYKRELIPWHWHGELELLWLESGSCLYQTLQETYTLTAGDAIYLNPGVLHQFEPTSPGTVSYANLFKAEFLTGRAGSYWDTSFVSPILNQSEVEAVVLRQTDPDAAETLRLVRETVRLCRDEPPCHELLLRNVMSAIWIELMRIVKSRMTGGKQRKSGARDVRLKKMLLMIGERYPESLTVRQIADAANISERECYRLFQESLKQTPILFLQRYRLQQAAALLAERDISMTEIAGRVGFDSPAYFSKLFRRTYGMTPMQMRKASLAGSL